MFLTILNPENLQAVYGRCFSSGKSTAYLQYYQTLSQNQGGIVV
jgi:hypothetical protein